MDRLITRVSYQSVLSVQPQLKDNRPVFVEWIPNGTLYISKNEFPVKAGDRVRFTLDVQDSGNAMAVIENFTTNHAEQWHLTGFAQLNDLLCQANAEWIIEDFYEPNAAGGPSGNIAMANFYPIHWEDAVATKTDGEQVKVHDADEIFLTRLDDENARTGTFTEFSPYNEMFNYYIPGKGRANQIWDPSLPIFGPT